MIERQVAHIAKGTIEEENLTQALATLNRIDRFWTRAMALGPRAMELTSAA
jgi:hypothetical protein